LSWGNNETIDFLVDGVGFGKTSLEKKPKVAPDRYLYYKVSYGGVEDTYYYIGSMKHKDKEIPLYNGIEHGHTIAINTILEALK